MKKEILITLLCAGLMLVTPFTTVARENKITSNISEQPDIEDDCDLCSKVSKSHLIRLKSLLNRLEKNNIKLFTMLKNKPRVEEKYQELSKRINEFLEVYNGLKPDTPIENIKPLCIFLLILFGRILIRISILYEILWFLEDNLPNSILLYLYLPIFYFLFFTIGYRGGYIWNLGREQDCDWAVFKTLSLTIWMRF